MQWGRDQWEEHQLKDFEGTPPAALEFILSEKQREVQEEVHVQGQEQHSQEDPTWIYGHGHGHRDWHLNDEELKIKLADLNPQWEQALEILRAICPNTLETSLLRSLYDAEGNGNEAATMLTSAGNS